jgi:hypothetical protein
MSCSWAKTYPLMGHGGPIRIGKSIWLSAFIFFRILHGYVSNEYRYQIRIQVSDTLWVEVSVFRSRRQMPHQPPCIPTLSQIHNSANRECAIALDHKTENKLYPPKAASELLKQLRTIKPLTKWEKGVTSSCIYEVLLTYISLEAYISGLTFWHH